MRIAGCIWIHESHTQFCSCRIGNRALAIIGCGLQLSVAAASMLQHVISIYLYRHIFNCRSNIDESTAPWETVYLAYDIIIFDFGLMRRILGMEECVANYLDGGYMRSLWCVQQASALSLALASLIVLRRPLWLLWPALLMQSSYSLGLSVLTMATAPKMLDALSGRVEPSLALRFVVFFVGFSFNWLLCFVLWHHYWALEKSPPPPACACLAPATADDDELSHERVPPA